MKMKLYLSQLHKAKRQVSPLNVRNKTRTENLPFFDCQSILLYAARPIKKSKISIRKILAQKNLSMKEK
jgi:hypothetical protein